MLKACLRRLESPRRPVVGVGVLDAVGVGGVVAPALLDDPAEVVEGGLRLRGRINHRVVSVPVTVVAFAR